MSYKHTSFGKQLIRLLIGLFVAIGFGLFWFSIYWGISNAIIFFVVGIIAIVTGIAVIAFEIAKYNRFNY